MDKIEYGKMIYDIFSHRTIDELSGCWIFEGSTTDSGYGLISQRKIRVHRLMYAVAKGIELEDIDKLDIHHDINCISKKCFNPEHLSALTKSEHRIIHERPEPGMCPKGHPFVRKSSGNGCRTCFQQYRYTYNRTRRKDLNNG